MCVKIKCSGRSATSRSSQSAGDIFRKIPSARMGFKSSCTRPRFARSASLCFAASSNSPMYCSISSGFLLYFSCTIFRLAPARFTTPLDAPQCGHERHLLHFSASFLESAFLGTISSRALRNRRRYCAFSSGDTITREHVLHTCCRIAMTFLKYPMWNTGISSFTYPKCPAQSMSFPLQVAHSAPFLSVVPILGSRIPFARGIRCGIWYKLRSNTWNTPHLPISDGDIRENLTLRILRGASTSVNGAFEKTRGSGGDAV
mmetsp:Transcript_9760/g.36203  ORF Transcript_9760/g.36203 Transcript_9760/m.36203 type:complete len:259 (+) Transcript_9760:4858-5634(+)